MLGIWERVFLLLLFMLFYWTIDENLTKCCLLLSFHNCCWCFDYKYMIYLYVYAKCLKRIYSCMISMYIKCSFTYCPFSQYVILSNPYAAPSFIQSICNFFQIFHISNFILPTMPDFPNLIYYYYIPFFSSSSHIIYYIISSRKHNL